MRNATVVVVRFSANLGFLWTHLSLPAAVRAAGNAGFDAVEFHSPFHVDAAEMSVVMSEAGVDAVSLNTRFGDRDGDFGVAAIVGREDETRRYIDEAIGYALVIGCPAVHVTAGRSNGASCADDVYCTNLSYAAEQAAKHELTILIEPLSDPRYHLRTIDHGLETIATVGASNLLLLVDCFHAWHCEPDLNKALIKASTHLGHVQFASIPDRHEPNLGEVDYSELLPRIVAAGYAGSFGAEYHPVGDTDDGMSWLAELRDRL